MNGSLWVTKITAATACSETPAERALCCCGSAQQVNVGGKKRKNALDGIGGGGSMRAAGGGGSYEDYAHGSSRQRVEFQRGRD